MARPKKIGLDYFPMDCTWDEKMQGLELIHQNNGIVWIVKFWQRAYQTETGEVDFSGLFGVIQANNCRITIEEHQKIIDTCLQLELLYKTESGLYTSNGIKKRIGAVSKERSDAIERKKFPSLSEDKEEKESKVKETPHCSANNSEQLPNNEMIPLPNSETIPLQEIVPAKKEPTWRTDFEIYQAECKEAFSSFSKNFEFMEKQNELNPGVDVLTTLKKAYHNFWNKEAGWKNKKKTKTKVIDWEATIINSITSQMNRVYLLRASQFSDNGIKPHYHQPFPKD